MYTAVWVSIWDIGMGKPCIDLNECNLCESCIAVCPAVFFINGAGMIEMVEMDRYPEADVNEAIKYCPEDCIFWEDC